MEATLYFDGASKGNPGPAGVGVRLLNTNQQTIAEKSFFIGNNTNNVAEYMGLIYGIQVAIDYNVSKLNIFSDSLLVVNHINGIYKITNSKLKPLYNQAIKLLEHFTDGFIISHIDRSKNSRADELANQAIRRAC
ncbi:MAG: ribonuclease HI family protein [Sphaerochaetaceae bacterium]|nr:ribonuclease HI family protein [Sphaerochaetaceae bacterium]